MSLNRTLARLFDEIRREAKRNPGFADRLDAVLRLHDSHRDVADEVVEEIARASSPASGGGGERSEPEGASVPTAAAPSQAQPDSSLPLERKAIQDSKNGSREATGGAGAKKRATPPPALNPTGLLKREGEEALGIALAGHDLGALRALVAEHNLDPSGVTSALTRDELAAHVVAQAKARAARDEKMFEY